MQSSSGLTLYHMMGLNQSGACQKKQSSFAKNEKDPNYGQFILWLLLYAKTN